MGKKAVSGIMLTLLLTGVLTLAFNIPSVGASGTIYIRPDGSVEGTDKIQRKGEVYTLTDSIYDSIVVERNNIVVDGAGYTVQGSGTGKGMDLTLRNNVTIRNVEIKVFYHGIWLDGSSNNSVSGNNIAANGWCGILLTGSSNHNSLSGNNITANDWGILLEGSDYNSISGSSMRNNRRGIVLAMSSNNNVSGNHITANYYTGIEIHLSESNSVSGNVMAANGCSGIELWISYNNSVSGNVMENNDVGIMFGICGQGNSVSGNNVTANKRYGMFLSDETSNNFIYHNNFIDNAEQVGLSLFPGGYTNVWDDGYPSGGNYWSDYIAKGGHDADGDGIGDIPYSIDAYNEDRYPLMNPWDTTPPVANAGPDQTVCEDTLVTFDGSGSYDNIGITSYVWTFIDVIPQTLTGVSPTYTFTTAGIYTVTLRVSDAGGNYATDTVSITVLSLTPEDLTRKLIEAIETWNLPDGTESSLTSKLEETILLLDKKNANGAVHKLMDFMNQVEALREEKLTNEQADYLTAEAQGIIDLIEG